MIDEEVLDTTSETHHLWAFKYKGSFGIPYKISYPHNESYDFYITLIFFYLWI